jgi:AcrR family transcriptional regulator
MSADRRAGRPRSDATRRAILNAAVDELRERGYAAMTIERIAARAGAGKQTIYRWWPSKADVVLDALLEMAAEFVEVPDHGSLRADLDSFLAASFKQRGQRPILRALMAQAVLDPAFGRAFRERFLSARRAVLRGVLERAVAREEIAPDEDLDLLVDIVFGVLWYRLLSDHGPLDEEAGRALAELVERAVR